MSAKQSGGVVVPTSVAILTGCGLDLAKRHLESLVDKGYAESGHGKTGSWYTYSPTCLRKKHGTILNQYDASQPVRNSARMDWNTALHNPDEIRVQTSAVEIAEYVAKRTQFMDALRKRSVQEA